MSRIQIEGETEHSKEKLTIQLVNLVKGRLSILKKEILDIEHEIFVFQNKYAFNNEKFLEKFESGELGDDEDYFVWKGSIEILKSLHEEEIMLREVL